MGLHFNHLSSKVKYLASIIRRTGAASIILAYEGAYLSIKKIKKDELKWRILQQIEGDEEVFFKF